MRKKTKTSLLLEYFSKLLILKTTSIDKNIIKAIKIKKKPFLYFFKFIKKIEGIKKMTIVI